MLHIFYHYGFKRIGSGKWSEPFKCSPHHVFWRPRKWRDQFVVAGYSWMFDEDRERHFMVNILKSLNGLSWENISTVLDYSTDGNETKLLVENDTLTAFSREEAGSNHEMLISTYMPKENRWETVSSGRIIQAPDDEGYKTVADSTRVDPSRIEYIISDYSMHEYYPSIRSPEDIETPCDIYVSRIHFRGERS